MARTLSRSCNGVLDGCVSCGFSQAESLGHATRHELEGPGAPLDDDLVFDAGTDHDHRVDRRASPLLREQQPL